MHQRADMLSVAFVTLPCSLFLVTISESVPSNCELAIDPLVSAHSGRFSQPDGWPHARLERLKRSRKKTFESAAIHAEGFVHGFTGSSWAV
jgi:hypothetical protein